MEPLEEAVPERLAQAEIDSRRLGRAPRHREHPPRRRGQAEVLEHVTVSLLAEGHILVEDYPGVGKTALARALSRSIDCAVRARAVHGRPAARRHRRLADLQPARGALRVPARARSSPTSCSSTRSTAPRRRRSRACSSACRSATSPSTPPRTSSRGRSWSSRRRTRSSTRAPIRCPRRRSTASWSGSRSATPTPRPRPGCCSATSRATACSTSSPSPTAPRSSRRSRPRTACTPRARCATTSSRCCGARATTSASSSARPRAPA